jgi:hypothetical protein
MNGRWVPCLVVAILGLSVIANVILIRSAGADPSFVTEPDYYRDAVAWDEHMAKDRASVALGWRVSPLLTLGAEGRAQLVVHIVDANGAVVSEAQVHIAASPNLCGKQRTSADASPDAAIDVGPACPGLWRIDIEATRGGAMFSERLIAELGGPP